MSIEKTLPPLPLDAEDSAVRGHDRVEMDVQPTFCPVPTLIVDDDTMNEKPTTPTPKLQTSRLFALGDTQDLNRLSPTTRPSESSTLRNLFSSGRNASTSSFQGPGSTANPSHLRKHRGRLGMTLPLSRLFSSTHNLNAMVDDDVMTFEQPSSGRRYPSEHGDGSGNDSLGAGLVKRISQRGNNSTRRPFVRKERRANSIFESMDLGETFKFVRPTPRRHATTNALQASQGNASQHSEHTDADITLVNPPGPGLKRKGSLKNMLDLFTARSNRKAERDIPNRDGEMTVGQPDELGVYRHPCRPSSRTRVYPEAAAPSSYVPVSSRAESKWNLGRKTSLRKGLKRKPGNDPGVDGEIGNPMLVSHDLHVNASFKGLPSAWIDRLKEQGLHQKEMDMIMAGRRQRRDSGSTIGMHHSSKSTSQIAPEGRTFEMMAPSSANPTNHRTSTHVRSSSENLVGSLLHGLQQGHRASKSRLQALHQSARESFFDARTTTSQEAAETDDAEPYKKTLRFRRRQGAEPPLTLDLSIEKGSLSPPSAVVETPPSVSSIQGHSRLSMDLKAFGSTKLAFEKDREQVGSVGIDDWYGQVCASLDSTLDGSYSPRIKNHETATLPPRLEPLSIPCPVFDQPLSTPSQAMSTNLTAGTGSSQQMPSPLSTFERVSDGVLPDIPTFDLSDADIMQFATCLPSTQAPPTNLHHDILTPSVSQCCPSAGPEPGDETFLTTTSSIRARDSYHDRSTLRYSGTTVSHDGGPWSACDDVTFLHVGTVQTAWKARPPGV